MQNKIVKMTRATLAFMFIVWLGATPVLAKQYCWDWIREYVPQWRGLTLEEVYVCLDDGLDVHEKNQFGWVPLHAAAWGNKNPKVITTLLRAGADVNAQNDEGKTPLHKSAAWNENPEVIMILLKSGADGKIRDKNGKTAFELAEKNEAIKNTKAYWLLNDAQYK